MASNLNLSGICEEIEKRLPSQEAALGKGLLQPFNNTNSGSRKIMQGIQKEQGMQLEKAETPIIMTGYENQFGELSSTFVRSERNLVVIDKIPKYKLGRKIEESNYWVIALDAEHGVIDAIERIDYRHISESYGYKMDSSYVDSLQLGDTIPKGTPYIKSNSYDSANNKCDGVNLSTVYMALAETTEDPIILSQTAAAKFTAPLFDTTQLQINDNDILLNLYGDDANYKTFPDIGESIEKGILCAIRRERKDDEALYAQAWDRLKEMMISDDKYTLKGKIVDINVYCNNPEKLESSAYNQQIAKYYALKLEFCRRVVSSMDELLRKHLTMTHAAEVLYYTSKRVIEGKQYINDKVFNNIVLEIVTMESKELKRGDKITDRYGGKGVVSGIWKDEFMPKYQQTYPDGSVSWVPVDAIYDNSTIVNRENPGQAFECEITEVGCRIVERIATILYQNQIGADYDPFYRDRNQDDMYYNNYGADDAVMRQCENMVYEYLRILNSEFAEEYIYMVNSSAPDIRFEMLNSMTQDGCIYVVIPPISGGMNIDKLRELYDAFPWVDQVPILVPQRGSNGEYRFIPARRKLMPGKKYLYRLKQFAEEKMSAVSLASTNIRSENTKSKANKLHKVVHATTPVRFGEMEFEDLAHMAVELIIQVLMLLSSSPGGRRLHEQLLTGDPFSQDVKLDSDSKSRSVEIINAYLKTIGLKLVFEKVPKKKGNRALREIVAKIPSNHILQEVAHRVPHQLRESIMQVAEERIKHKNKAMKLVPIVDRVPLGLTQAQADELVKNQELIKAADEICQLAAEYNKPGQFKGHESKEDLIKRAINDDPKEKLPVVAQRIVVTRLTQSPKSK